jgi:hypothetical protein
MKVSIKQHEVRGKIKWVVNILHQGKRRRKFFDSWKEANSFDVVDWLGELSEKEPTGDKTILRIARDEYLKAYDEENYNKFKKKQKGYLTTEERVNKFLKWFGEGRFVSEVKEKDYHEYVNSSNWSFKTKQGYSASVRTFMAWCGKKGYGANEKDWYIKDNESLKLVQKKVFFKLPGILQVEEARSLLEAMPDKYKPAMAIALFTGIRPEGELSLLQYSDIQYGERIGLKAEITKTGYERWIVPPPNLWKWLPKRTTGLVMPSYSGFNQARRRASRRAYGWKNNGRRGGGGVEGFDYPANGARHSFASYAYWHLGFETSLDIMGHMSSETFLKNYKNNRVDKKIAKAYFSIAPNRS